MMMETKSHSDYFGQFEPPGMAVSLRRFC
jgi:hypothetical protein